MTIANSESVDVQMERLRVLAELELSSKLTGADPSQVLAVVTMEGSRGLQVSLINIAAIETSGARVLGEALRRVYGYLAVREDDQVTVLAICTDSNGDRKRRVMNVSPDRPGRYEPLVRSNPPARSVKVPSHREIEEMLIDLEGRLYKLLYQARTIAPGVSLGKESENFRAVSIGCAESLSLLGAHLLINCCSDYYDADFARIKKEDWPFAERYLTRGSRMLLDPNENHGNQIAFELVTSMYALRGTRPDLTASSSPDARAFCRAWSELLSSIEQLLEIVEIEPYGANAPAYQVG